MYCTFFDAFFVFHGLGVRVDEGHEGDIGSAKDVSTVETSVGLRGSPIVSTLWAIVNDLWRVWEREREGGRAYVL